MPASQDDGFHDLVLYARQHVTELIEELCNEHDDHGLRCWLLELIGEARSDEALPLLTEQLYGRDQALREGPWRACGSWPRRRHVSKLWRARCNRLID